MTQEIVEEFVEEVPVESVQPEEPAQPVEEPAQPVEEPAQPEEPSQPVPSFIPAFSSEPQEKPRGACACGGGGETRGDGGEACRGGGEARGG